MSYYSSTQALFIAVGFSLFDFLFNFIGLAWNGRFFSTQNIVHWFDLHNYEFSRNPVDFLAVAVLRVCILIGGAVGVYADPEGASQACAKISNLILAVVLIILAFAPTKLLAFYEHDELQLAVGDWILMIWCVIASLTVQAIWVTVFSNVKEIAPGHNREQIFDESREQSKEAEDKQRQQRETIAMLFRLFGYLAKEWPYYLLAFTFLFLYSLSRIFIPYYTGEVVAAVFGSEASYEKLHRTVGIMAFLSLSGAVFGGLRGGSFTYSQARIDRRIRNDLFKSLTSQEIGFFDENKTGELCSRLNADCQTMSNTLSLYMNVLTRNLTMLFGSLIFMFSLSWRLSMVTFIAIPIIFLVSKVYGVYYDRLAEETQSSIAKANDVAEEVISAIRTVKSFACEKFESLRFLDFLNITLSIATRKSIAHVGFLWTSEILQMGILIVVLWYGGHLLIDHRVLVSFFRKLLNSQNVFVLQVIGLLCVISLNAAKIKIEAGLLVSFLLYQFQLGDNLRELGEVWNALMQAVGASRKVFEFIDRKPLVHNNGRLSPDGRIVQLEGKIEFRNVKFSYPTRPDLPVMKDVSFTANPGEVVALVGPSGSGKSSCIAMLEHFYEPSGGQVLLDGIPIRDYDHQFLHTKIALVGQEPVLYARSVKENIRYGYARCSDGDIQRAAKLANAHNFIMDTTDGYETDVGEKGSQMSGGQKQRIAIARALVRDPVVLLLDEATSALDAESEHIVQEAISRNLKGRTVILIAHRLSTVENADKIVVINEGRVEQIGTHNDLIARDGLYKQLVQRQMTGLESDSPPKAGSEDRFSSVSTSAQQQLPMPRSKRIRIDDRKSSTTGAQSFLGTSFASASSYI